MSSSSEDSDFLEGLVLDFDEEGFLEYILTSGTGLAVGESESVPSESLSVMV
ncbi:hypothetical protein A2U01_0010516 [Trifolium medium]|uniref:Uncharacterized protein n=1 Tax=Trifolium medium TaxID=97028 RepID=A0A392MQ09_9FABA|nr:hypothetical protein [Trifolium medium]